MVDVFDKITDTIVECIITLQNPLDNKSNRVSGTELLIKHLVITDEQMKCIAVRLIWKLQNILCISVITSS